MPPIDVLINIGIFSFLKDCNMNTLIIIPAYNVENQIKPLLYTIKQTSSIDVLVIDDGSQDNTANIVKEHGFMLIKHEENQGLAAAINTGLRFAMDNNYDCIITLDADGQHDPCLIGDFIERIEEYDCVFGNRFSNITHIPSVKISSNLFASLIVQCVSGKKLFDVSCGYRAFRLSSISSLSSSDNYGIIYEQVYHVLENGINYTTIDVPVIYDYDQLLCTKVKEIEGLITASINHCKDSDFCMALNAILKNVKKKEDFKAAIDGFLFCCFYLPNRDAYICQNDVTKNSKFYNI